MHIGLNINHICCMIYISEFPVILSKGQRIYCVKYKYFSYVKHVYVPPT